MSFGKVPSDNALTNFKSNQNIIAKSITSQSITSPRLQTNVLSVNQESVTDLIIDGGGTSNYLLTSQGPGLPAIWTAPPTPSTTLIPVTVVTTSPLNLTNAQSGSLFYLQTNLSINVNLPNPATLGTHFYIYIPIGTSGLYGINSQGGGTMIISGFSPTGSVAFTTQTNQNIYMDSLTTAPTILHLVCVNGGTSPAWINLNTTPIQFD